MPAWLHAYPPRCCLFFKKALLLSFPKAIVISHSVLAGCMEKREGQKSQRSCDKKGLSVLSPLCMYVFMNSNNTTVFFFLSQQPEYGFLFACTYVHLNTFDFFLSLFSGDYNAYADFEKSLPHQLRQTSFFFLKDGHKSRHGTTLLKNKREF